LKGRDDFCKPGPAGNRGYFRKRLNKLDNSAFSGRRICA
jgi:hypothetical protein